MSNYPPGWNEDYEDEPEVESAAEAKPTGEITITIGAGALEQMERAVTANVIDRLSASIEKAVRNQIIGLVDEAVRKVIGDKAEAIITEQLERPRQKFDMWGNPTGPTVAFVDQIPATVESWMNQKVDDKGGVSYHGSDNKATRAAWIIGQHVKAHIDPAVQNAVSSVTKQARDIVTAKVSTFVAEQMMPAIDVQKIGVR